MLGDETFFLAHQYSVDVDSCQDRCQAGYCSDHGPKDALVTGPPPTGILPMRALPPADVYFCLPTKRWTPWPDLGEKQPPKDTFKRAECICNEQAAGTH